MVSIIIPLYNKENSICATISSVLSQSYKDFELIIVDDGSTDSSAEHVAIFRDPRIKYVHQNNGGVSSARNTGISLALSEYLVFLDSDDLWEPSFLLEMTNLIKDFPDAGIWGLGYKLFSQGKISERGPHPCSGLRGIVERVWDVGSPYWTSATAVSKKALSIVGAFDERISIGEDIDLWWRILLNCHGAYYDVPLALYNIGAENRAMRSKVELSRYYACYSEKYSAVFAQNSKFRAFYERECLYALFQFAGDRHYRKDLRAIINKFDFSLQKKSMRLRFIFPRLYRVYLRFFRHD